ncbi:MAG TPA: phage portal protein [Actinophytocola sp.]|uniref:phage portal protein n=1 Tax=Actinophytocola sp. TaxID=1872138 RepID=UPI002DBDD7D7|nr:phage portal protein [Actinophytocola sp.]HEU5475694.1 phage portal protein [Actinophytocola sp.]
MLKTSTGCTAPGGYWDRRRVKGGTVYHLPLAGDIARTSAELVAGDTPAIDWEGDALQKAWDDLAQDIGWANILLEAFEVAAALGGVYLRPAWDNKTANHPLLTAVRADEALPTFRFGRLSSVTFVTYLDAPDAWSQRGAGEVWRWLEHHEPGQIRQELWLGTATSVGSPRPLDEHPMTEGLAGVVDTRGIRDGILVEYIPNDLPQPLDPLPLGRADIQGVETLLDALDETWDSWMRDIRLGKGRILLSREMLTSVRPSSAGGWRGLFGGRQENTNPAAAFDVDAEAFVPLDTPAEDQGKQTPITLNQFAIRVKEHFDTAMALVEQITSRAGYAPQTMGMDVDGATSGTARRLREIRSIRTRDRKRRYGRRGLERLAETLMLIGASTEFGGGPRPTRQPTLKWAADAADPKETAETIQILRSALAMSVEMAVRAAHPEWDDKQVDEEVGRILAEQAAMVAPAPTGFEPDQPEPDDDGQVPGTITPEQANVFGTLIRSGVDPQEAARQAWGGSVRMIPRATPVTIKVGEDEPAPPPVPGAAPKPPAGPPVPGR